MANCHEKNQSAINETRDQLFIDTADSNRLNVVTANLGLNRPILGFSDALWRAMAKAVALTPKQIRNIFHRIVELCVGPQFARIGVLSDDVAVGDMDIALEDSSQFIQLGTAIVDPGLASEETRTFCFRDLVENKIYFSSPLSNIHTPIVAASSLLISDIIVGAVSVPVFSSFLFPTAGFPYPIMLGRGTLEEEIVTVSANNTLTNILTVSPTVNAHSGPHNLFARVTLSAATFAGRYILFLSTNDTNKLPPNGFLFLDQGGVNAEVVEYTSFNRELETVELKRPLQFNHAVTDIVELCTSGDLVETAQVVQEGLHWKIIVTSDHHVVIELPSDFQILGPLDASWMHDVVPVATSTLLVAAVAPTDLILRVTAGGLAGFVNEAGMLLINGIQTAFYNVRLASTDLNSVVDADVLAGVTSIVYDGDTPLNVRATLPSYLIRLDPGGANQEDLTVLSVDEVTHTIVFTTATVNPHIASESIQYHDQLVLSQPLGNAYLIGDTVALLRVPYAGTDLEEGNTRDSLGNIDLDHFAGPYIFEMGTRGVSNASSFLEFTLANFPAPVPPPTTVANDQSVGRTCLEVVDASLWPSPPYATLLDVRIGRFSGFQEDQDLIDRTLKVDVAGTVNGAHGINVTVLNYTLTTVTEFPESSTPINSAGYRIIVDRGGPNEEILLISQNDISLSPLNVFTLINPTNIAHGPAAETIELLADVLTFDPLVKFHQGPILVPNTLGSKVEMLVDTLKLNPAPTAAFPTSSGIIWLNFGKEFLDIRVRIVSITGPAVYKLEITDDFPATANTPYQVILGEGLANEELIFVSANNTALDELTFVTVPVNVHVAGEYVRFISGVPEVVEYESRVADIITLSTPTIFESRHVKGERVVYSPAESQSHIDGSSYGFKLPPDPAACLINMIDLVRAAGIKVDIILKEPV